MEKAYLLLENGMVFEGMGFGAAGTRTGEAVFTTGMTGCAESLTDPSYHGQIIIFTFPMIGNYGIAHADMESASIHARGVVVRELCEIPSNFRSDESVDSFLKAHNVPGISGIDTRFLTQLIRDQGVMNAVITSEMPVGSVPSDLRAYRVTEAVESVSPKQVRVTDTEDRAEFSVALIDYGAKKSITSSLVRRGCRVTAYPYDTPAEVILAAGHNGVMLSNGPGDPADNTFSIAQIEKLMGRLPTFGICLGHQMMALAAGGETVKMKFGHRGANQPVKDLETGRVFITSQNHGYAVASESLASSGAVTRYINVNDGTCEGVDYPSLNAFSLQFHPEAHGGPLDCEGMFDRFIAMMGGCGRA
jgi:carbamoyl-phosphate synthase small subunit